MRLVPTATATLVGVVLVALLAASGGAAVADASPSVESCAAESPSDFAPPEDGDAIGYVDGYWYDEPIGALPPAEDGGDSTGNDDNSTGDDGNSTANGGNSTGDDGSSTGGNGTETAGGTEGASENETATAGNETVDGGENETDDRSDDEQATDDGSDGGNGTTAKDGGKRSFDASDGLDERELDAFVARTAARVETLRCLSFEEVPPVRVENRSVVRDAQRAEYAEWSQATRRYDDARLAAALLVGTDANATAARAETTTAATLGYYDQGTDSIAIVAAENVTARVDEATLAHELVHALQDQHFDLDRFDARRTDAVLAESGLIEGDASLVEHRYEQRCEDGDWATDCLTASPPASGDGGNFALELFFFQPYNDGPHYVEGVYESGGWDAVDARYDDPPRTTRALLFSGDVRDDIRPRNVTFEPVTDPGWVRVNPEGQPTTDVLGPGTIGAAMLAPTFETDTDGIYDAQLITNNVDQSTLDPLHPYDYGIDAATGWRGGGLQVYRDEDNRTATRWRTTWTSDDAATTFRERYVELLAVRGAASSRNYAGTYHFPPESDYSGRVAVRQNGTSVTVVHAPDLEAVRALDAGAAREPREGSSSSMTGIGASKRAAEDALPGPGVAGAILGLAVAIGLVGWSVLRRR